MFLRLLFLATLLGSWASSQTIVIHEVLLRPSEAPRVTQEIASTVLAPVKCDSAGSIYFRVSGKSAEFQEPIVKITADAKERISFDARTDSQLPKDFIGSEFAVDAGGGVYQIVLTRTFEVFFVHFNPRGAIESKSRSSEIFNPRLLYVLPSGDLFVLGAPLQGGSSSVKSDFIFATFDANGKRKSPEHRLTLPEEFQAQVGTDGELYVLTSSGISVYSQDSEKLMELLVRAGSDQMQLRGWQSFGNHLFLEWTGESASPANPGAGSIVAIDTTTGRSSARYLLSDTVGGGLACVSEKGFTFLAVEADGHLSLLHADRPK